MRQSYLKNLQIGCIVKAKVGMNGVICQVTEIKRDSNKILATVEEIDNDMNRVSPGRSYVITEDNALAFRYVSDPNPEEKPKYTVREGRLCDSTNAFVEMGSIKADSILGCVRGAVIFAAKRDDENIDIMSYLPRSDRFRKLLVNEKPNPVVMLATDDEIYLGNCIVSNEQDEKELRRRLDCSMFAALSKQEVKDRKNFSFEFNPSEVRVYDESSRPVFAFEYTNVSDDEDILEPTNSHNYCIFDEIEAPLYVAFGDKPVESIYPVAFNYNSYILKNSTQVVYVESDNSERRVCSQEIQKLNGFDNLVDYTNETMVFANDELTKLLKVTSKQTQDRGTIVTVKEF